MSGRHSNLTSPDGRHDHQSTREDHLVAAMEECRAAMDAGQSIDRHALLQRYADVADELVDCLAGMDIVQAVAKQVNGAGDDESVADSPPAITSHTLGDFRIVREIGRGGMGVVYEAEQLSLGRPVAIKVLPYAAMMDDRQLQRFRNEARAAATLNHTNIVPVYFVGTERSVHFYAMQLIEGQSLGEIIAQMRAAAGDSSPEINRSQSTVDTKPIAALSTEYSTNPKHFFRTVAEIGIQIAQALGHAHEHGIIHRDVKPGNILIDKHGNPWITDFGLARMDTDGSITVSGDFLGTLRYMSPEQASGERRLVDHRTDVYSLGATLYELATLGPAFDGRNREELFRQITSEHTPSLRSIDPSVPVELGTILLKTMEKDPLERYASTEEFAEDLRRFLKNEPIKARRPSLTARGTKWARRHAGVFVSLTLVLAVTLMVTFVAYYLTSRERAKTAAALEKAEENFGFALQAVDGMYLELATQWIADGTAPTLIQQDFLQRARFFYETVAQQPLNTPQDRAQAASVYERIGQIERFLANYGPADAAFQRSIELGEMLVCAKPANNRLRSELPRRYRMRADTLRQSNDLPEAETAYESGLAHWEILRERDVLMPEDELERVRIDHGMAELALRMNQIERAESHVQDARQRTDSSVNDSQLIPNFRRLDVENRRLLATIFLARGDLAAALEEAKAALTSFRIRRDWMFSEDRTTMQFEAQLIELMGQIAEAGNEWSQARDHYLASLEIRRQNLKSHKEPSQFFVTTRLMGEKGQYEAAAFCSYVETHLRLARVLVQLGRPYEAEYRLGQCQLASYVVSADRLDVLRYHVAEANTWAFVWTAIHERRPTEASIVLDYAVLIWREILARFPSAAHYQSGVHRCENDLAWFRSLLDTEHEAQLMDNIPLVVSAELRGPPNIAFFRDATGRSWFDAGDPKSAVFFLKESVRLREADHAYAWLQLAMAHAELGELVEAERWLNKATDEMSQTGDSHPELIELREAAQSQIRSPSSHESSSLRNNETRSRS